MPIIFNSAVELIRSTNLCSVDLDKHFKLQNIASSLRTLLTFPTSSKNQSKLILVIVTIARQ